MPIPTRLPLTRKVGKQKAEGRRKSKRCTGCVCTFARGKCTRDQCPYLHASAKQLAKALGKGNDGEAQGGGGNKKGKGKGRSKSADPNKAAPAANQVGSG